MKNQPLKVGVVGTGSVVREIYQYFYWQSDFSHLMSIEAICDLNEPGLNAFGDEHNIPADRRFTSAADLIDRVDLDVLAVNTPDSYHTEPVLAALDAGLDVFVPKPIADRIEDAHAMITRAQERGRFIGVDFHKREDPRIKEAKARYQHGDYGQFQGSVWYMLDKLSVADPNHEPRFFATADFAVKNTPVSFLTVHMIDAFMYITELKPVEVRATGYKQKLPTLQPIAVDGYDMVDTEVLFENGGVCHVFTGWALPNTAHALTVQSARVIGSEGMLDLSLDRPGYHEILHDGIFERNPMFRNFEPDGSVSGYGMASPGRIMRNIARFRQDDIAADELGDLNSMFSLGFYTTAVCEAAHASLDHGAEINPGVIRGEPVNIKELVTKQIGKQATTERFG